MAIHTSSSSPAVSGEPAASPSSMTMGHPVAHLPTPAARGVMAFGRISVGFIFLWAFLDKAFGLGYMTPPESAWIRGGVPMTGFIKHELTGPLTGLVTSMNTPLFNALFMLGMLGVGAAMMLGIGTRIAAVAGTFIMAFMWLATWPRGGGESTNPIVDYHWAYAAILILAALTYSGRTFGLGVWWEKLVGKQRWLV